MNAELKPNPDLRTAIEIRRHPRVVIVGARMSARLSAIKLRDAGKSDITILEKANKVGGTWRDNTYPRLSCDVPAHKKV